MAVVIPKSKGEREVPFAELVIDISKNVRMAELYDVKALAEDIKATGLRDALVVHKTKNGYEVLRGFRRGLAIAEIRKSNPAMFQLVRCIVYDELDQAQQAAILCDHGNVELLNDFELFQSATKLFQAGFTEEEVGAAHGKSRSWAQERKMLAQLPPFVQDELKKKFLKVDGKRGEGISMKDVRALYTLQMQNGNDSSNPSPVFLEAWNKITKPEGRTATIQSRSRKNLLELANMLKHNKDLIAGLRFAAGEDIKIADLDDPNWKPTSEWVALIPKA